MRNSSPISVWVSDDVGSSRISSFGRQERARAISTSCFWAVERRRTGVRGSSRRPEPLEQGAGVGVEPGPVEQAGGAGRGRFAAEEDVAGDVEAGDQVQLLVDHRDAERLGRPGGRGSRQAAPELDRPLVGLDDAVEDLHQGGLAGAVLADQGVDLAGAISRATSWRAWTPG
jgi:hypothetical protein